MPPDASDKSVRYEAPALDKGLDIVELLADRPEGLTQVEIARELSRSVGEIFRMLMSLVRRRYVTILRPGDRYVLTLKLFELAHRHGPLERLPAEAQPVLRALAAEIHQSAHLAIIEDDHAVIIAQADAPGPIGFAVRVGTVAHLMKSASGRVLSAFQHDDVAERMTARADGGALRVREQAAVLSRIRARGYEEMESTRIRGIHDVSFPVFDHRSTAIAALTVPFIERLDLSGKNSLEVAKVAIARAAKKLTVAMGGKEPEKPAAAAERGEGVRKAARRRGAS